MAPEIHFDKNPASEAMTWVFDIETCNLSKSEEAIAYAKAKGIFFGLHTESRNMLVQFPKPETREIAVRKLKVILGKGGATDVNFKTVESFDLFHAEFFGLVAVNAPSMPTPTRLPNFVEGDEMELASDATSDASAEDDASLEVSADMEPHEAEEEPEDVTELQAVEKVDIFSLACVRPTVYIPSMLEALATETAHEKELRASFGGLTPYLEEKFICRGIQHVEDVKNEALSLIHADREVVLWPTGEPPFVTVYGKLNMHKERRVQWVLWKAERIGIDLQYPDSCPQFFAIFKQVSMYRDDNIRLEQFKKAAKMWSPEFNWKDLHKSMQNLIKSINSGKDDCFCCNCGQVLNPKNKYSFCSDFCQSQFCDRCDTRKSVKQVTDWEEMGRRQNRVGDFLTLLDLSDMLKQKAVVSLYGKTTDVVPEFAKLNEKRAFRKCCSELSQFMPGLQCKQCEKEFLQLSSISRWVDLIASGKVTWGHCEVAVRQLKKLRDICPKKTVMFCQTCDSRSHDSRSHDSSQLERFRDLDAP
jgi:hypothetical protein